MSAITFWEVAMPKGKGRLDFPGDVGLWRREVLGQGVRRSPSTARLESEPTLC